MTPTNSNSLEVSKSVFDLDSKEMVEIRKVGNFIPVTDVNDFSTRLQNDAKLILEVINSGLKEYQKSQLANDENIKWQLVEEDENGVETLSEFSGNPVGEKAWKQFKQVVISLAKSLFGYEKVMVQGDVKANREAKDKAKKDALAMLIGNPATIEKLKAQN